VLKRRQEVNAGVVPQLVPAGARVFDDAMRRYLTEFWEFMAIIATSMTATASTPYLPGYCFILQLE
jgi:hypothetical protein